ncbi:tyrosine-type recombinase/integrase [Aestuariivivens sediminis]|uniref:tyrosine-type recombinase/integrase n=1 Tax=Aestuariivivens sediminis TaxID=2913557 RepID=UPI001F595521|nr:site-specific integrase [Aestuariivivens sediminis]
MNRLPHVILTKAIRRDEHQILIGFKHDQPLITWLKSLPEARWSATLKSWYIKDKPTHLTAIHAILKGRARVDDSKLLNNTLNKSKTPGKKQKHLLTEQSALLNNFYTYLKGKRYSKSTVDTYCFFIADFIAFHSSKNLYALSNRDVKLFIEDVFVKRNYAISTHRQFISALKLFVVFYPKTEISDLALTRPKKSRKLPLVLSQFEVIDIIRHTQNLKHRAIIALLYSSGLRISELLNLKLSDINIDRKQLHVKNGKGRKDRCVGLSESFIPLLSNYFYTYKPSVYFVEGVKGGPYSAESVRQFLKRSCRAARIYKPVTPHTLRHSYATHLLENGVDLRFIQELLGHAKPETTMIYTHVSRKDLLDIENPLDRALKRLGKTDNTNTNMLLSRNLGG